MKFDIYDLSQLPVGSRGVITAVRAKGQEKRRFIDLGFGPDMEVKALFKSPSGSQTAFEIMGAVFALRNEDACKITVRPYNQVVLAKG